MDREVVIRLAREAGYETDMFGLGIWDSAEFNRFAALVAAAEREAIAEMIEIEPDRDYWVVHSIRARGE